MDELLIFGISGVVIVTVLIQALKLWIPALQEGRWAILAAVVAGLVLAVANQMAQIIPGFETWYRVAFLGIVTGLAACGLYDVGKHAKPQP